MCNTLALLRGLEEHPTARDLFIKLVLEQGYCIMPLPANEGITGNIYDPTEISITLENNTENHFSDETLVTHIRINI